MVADNDAGGITTYTATGAQFDFHPIWFLILLGPVAHNVQETTVRLERSPHAATPGRFSTISWAAWRSAFARRSWRFAGWSAGSCGQNDRRS
jgi:hypothetical protein